MNDTEINEGDLVAWYIPGMQDGSAMEVTVMEIVAIDGPCSVICGWPCTDCGNYCAGFFHCDEIVVFRHQTLH